MNLIILFKEDYIDKTRVRLSGRRYDHILNIHRAHCGDQLTVGLMDGLVGTGIIMMMNDVSVELDVCLDREPPPALPVTLLLAMTRPLVFKRLLQTITTLGVKKIIIFQSNRVEKSFWLSPVLKEEEICEQLILGLEQAKDTIMPEIIFKKQFKPFVEDELPGIIKGKIAIVAHPSGDGNYPEQINEELVLAIGPEGGFIPYEIEKLIECGFQLKSLGERILKVETVVPILLSKSLL